MKKRLLALSMIAAMTAAMLAGCGTAGDSNNGGTADTKSASAEANTSKDDSGEYPEYKFGTNIWGSGSYVLESNAKTANVNYSGLGITVDGISNEFTADKITTDVQTQISDGCQAILEMCVTPPSFMSVSQICEENGIPFVLYDKTPGDEATKAAVEEGIISGGGSAYIHAAKEVAKYAATLEGDEKTGANVVLKALEAPLFHIAANAGLEGSVIINKVSESEPGVGFNALTEEYVDMVEAGILDPAKVTRSALQNATSVASTLLTTESCVANIKEDTPAMPAGGAPGMGMM